MASIKTFTIDNKPVRVMRDDNGILWFLVAEVAPLFGFSPEHLLTALDFSLVDLDNGFAEKISEHGFVFAALLTKKESARDHIDFLMQTIIPKMRHNSSIGEEGRQKTSNMDNDLRVKIVQYCRGEFPKEAYPESSPIPPLHVTTWEIMNNALNLPLSEQNRSMQVLVGNELGILGCTARQVRISASRISSGEKRTHERIYNVSFIRSMTI